MSSKIWFSNGVSFVVRDFLALLSLVIRFGASRLVRGGLIAEFLLYWKLSSIFEVEELTGVAGDGDVIGVSDAVV